MPSAQGHVNSLAGGNKFHASFTIDGLQYTLAGNLSPPVGDFSGNATLEYYDKGTLNGTRNVDGRITGSSLTLTVENGPRITSNAGTPDGSNSQVNGSAAWQSY